MTATGRVEVRLGALAGLLVAVVLLSLVTGAVPITPTELLAIVAKGVGLEVPTDFSPQHESVLLVIRWPRVALACLIGAALGCAGAAMQGHYRSPVADPALVGVAAGAALGAAAGRLLAIRAELASEPAGTLLVVLFAVASAWMASAAIHRVASAGGRIVVPTMLVSGMALSALFASATAFLVFAARDPDVGDITFWTMGSLAGARADELIIVLLVGIPVLTVLLRAGPALDALALGEHAAAHLGIDVRGLSRSMVTLVALLTAVAVALAGIIAFVALVTPVLARGLLGARQRAVVAGSALLGAACLVSADLVARTIVSPVELPVGAVTAVVGAPFLLWLLLRDRHLLAG